MKNDEREVRRQLLFRLWPHIRPNNPVSSIDQLCRFEVIEHGLEYPETLRGRRKGLNARPRTFDEVIVWDDEDRITVAVPHDAEQHAVVEFHLPPYRPKFKVD